MLLDSTILNPVGYPFPSPSLYAQQWVRILMETVRTAPTTVYIHLPNPYTPWLSYTGRPHLSKLCANPY